MSPNGVEFLGVLKMLDTVAHAWPWQMNTHIYASE